MKLQKQEIFEELKVKLGASRMISDRTINDSLEALMSFVGEETDLSAFVAQVLPNFTSMDGNLRHEVAEKAKALEEAAKAKEKTPEEIAAQKVIDDAKAAELLAEPAWAKTMREAQEARFAAMEAKLTGAETAKTIEQKKNTILETARAKYTDSVVEIAGEYFDFGAETAQADFEARCVNIGSKFGVKPLTGDPTPTDPKAQFLAQKAELIKEGVINTPV